MPLPAFRFKKFKVEQDGAAHPVGTDAVLLGSWADVRETTRFLDIGTGTGVIALMLAQRLECSGDFSRSNSPKPWTGVGVELHPASAALARKNFAGSPWATRLEVFEGPIQHFVEGKIGGFHYSDSLTPSETITIMETSNFIAPFDLIVSNPPFFSERTISPNQTRSLGRHTATLSPEDLLLAVRSLLTENGKFCAILPEQEGRRLCELAVQHGLYWTRILEVRSRPGKPIERLLLQFEKRPFDFEREEMCVYGGEKGGGYSDRFREMSGAFYLAG
jgi:tRNA1Val (adenine37-N6)-methyltransferase